VSRKYVESFVNVLKNGYNNLKLLTAFWQQVLRKNDKKVMHYIMEKWTVN